MQESNPGAGEQRRRTAEPRTIVLTDRESELFDAILKRRLAYMGGEKKLDEICEYTARELMACSLMAVARAEGVAT